MPSPFRHFHLPNPCCHCSNLKTCSSGQRPQGGAIPLPPEHRPARPGEATPGPLCSFLQSGLPRGQAGRKRKEPVAVTSRQEPEKQRVFAAGLSKGCVPRQEQQAVSTRVTPKPRHAPKSRNSSGVCSVCPWLPVGEEPAPPLRVLVLDSCSTHPPTLIPQSHYL